jgi:hypothetical protein
MNDLRCVFSSAVSTYSLAVSSGVTDTEDQVSIRASFISNIFI